MPAEFVNYSRLSVSQAVVYTKEKHALVMQFFCQIVPQAMRKGLSRCLRSNTGTGGTFLERRKVDAQAFEGGEFSL